MSFAAIGVGIAGIAAAGVGAALQPGAPDAPDYGAANREGIEADIETLGRRKEIEATARLGGELLLDGFTSKKVNSGDEGVAAELARLEGQVRDAQSRITTAEGALDDGTSYSSLGRNQPGLGRLSGTQRDLESAQADYDRLNSALIALRSSVDEGGDVTLYFDNEGNQVDRSVALDTDFTGISDIDQSVAAARAQLDFLDESAEAQFNLQQEWGSKFVQQQLDMLKEADPLGFEMREQMGQSILSEGFGTNLSDSQRQEVQQAARQGQSARGNIFGAAPAAAEALEVGDAGFRLRQQRLANAAAFMQGETPQAQFGSIAGAQQGAAPAGSFNLLPGVGLDPNAGARGAQFAQNNYGQQSQNWATGNRQDPWQTLLGGIAGGGVQTALGSLGGGSAAKTDMWGNPTGRWE